MNALTIERFFQRAAAEVDADPRWPDAHEALLCALESGAVRSASRRDDGTWHAHEWVKAAILAGFRKTQVAPIDGFFDKTAYPPRALRLDDGVRVVPGGTSIRRGAYVARSVVVMPPAFVNVGAHVGEGTMVDSHALVGSCAQIGRRVHLSAGAQIGGVLEPVNARPVVIEDGAFVGALAGVFEGVIVREHAVLAAGVVLTGSTPILDLVHGKEFTREIPAGAVVVCGSRPAQGAFAKERGIQLAAACIVKYRDARTDAALALEQALRG
ncbi:MAG: 2,3,4,5-tetrahydropyridine-2,6-dicarboxylate N-succinyltransferase [Planctomycetes bacterium]|nr:2,3,4,5-tetrahydropyridine-2,6-dicarboxylate N-succinyltransferase [Planctomycetota bacterium]